MAAAFGVAASALAVTELAATVVKCCVDYWRDVASAQADLNHLCKEVESLSAIAGSAAQLLKEPRGAKLHTARKLEVETALEDARIRLVELKKKLTSTSGKVHHRYGYHAMLWPFKSKFVEAEAQELARCGHAIAAALQVDQTGIILDVDRKTTLSKLPIAEGAAFDSHAEEHNPSCYPNTGMEVLFKIYLWVHDPKAKAIFWLNGMAGMGKSTFSRTVARSALAAGHLGASFFFKKGEGDRGGASKFFTTIVAQLVSREPMIVPYVQSAIDDDPCILGKSLSVQFERLLIEPLSKAFEKIAEDRKLLIVVDALDECDHSEDIQRLIHLFSSIKDLQHPKLRIFLTSRPELPIRLGFTATDVQGTYEHLILQEMPRSIIKHDIHAFLVAELEHIRRAYNGSVAQDRELPTEWPGETEIQILVEMAAPLFIAAATFCRFIANRKGGIPSGRLQKVLEYQGRNHESKLNATYLPVLEQQTDDLSLEDRDVVLRDFRHIVGSIVILASPLSAPTLARLLNTSPEKVWERLDLLHSVLNVPSEAEAPITLLHLSFRDFLLDQTTSRNLFSVNETYAHKLLATDCLRTMKTTLRMNICELQAPETLFKDVEPKRISDALKPEVQYACTYWVHHLAQSQATLSDYGEVHEFLTNHFLHWLEALSWMGKNGDLSYGILGTLRELVDTDTGSELILFLDDARYFVSVVIPGVELAPLQVYSSGLVFAPKSNIIRTTFASQIQKRIDVHLQVQGDWNVWTPDDHGGTVTSVVFSPDGTIVASASGDRTIRLWNSNTGKCMHTLKGHNDYVWSVTFSPDNTTMASASKDTTIRLWNAKTGGHTRTLEGHSGFIWSVTFSSDGKFMASASADKTIRLWKTQTGNLEHTFKGHSDAVFSVAFLPNSDIVASASGDGTIRFWNVNTGSHTQTLKENSQTRIGVRLVTFSPDGATLASALMDHTVRLWNTKSCTWYQTFGVDTLLRRMSFNEDGSSLLTDVGTIAIAGKTQLASTSLTAEETVSSRPAITIQLANSSGYGISRDRRWITQDACKLLWLPAHIRPDKSAIHGSMIAMSTRKGRITILRFTKDSLP